MSVCSEWFGGSAAGRDGVAEAAEVRLLPFTHQLEVQRLLAEVALARGVRLQLQTDLLPRLQQLIWNGTERNNVIRRTSETISQII